MNKKKIFSLVGIITLGLFILSFQFLKKDFSNYKNTEIPDITENKKQNFNDAVNVVTSKEISEFQKSDEYLNSDIILDNENNPNTSDEEIKNRITDEISKQTNK